MNGIYQVSNLGNVRTLIFRNNKIVKPKIKVMKPQIRNNYYIINLVKNHKRKQYSVHRLVAETFIPNPKEYKVVHHLDYNTFNNKVENLKWCTQKENVNYSIINMMGKNHKFKNKYYGICNRKNKNRYELVIKQKYYGVFKELKEALKKREEIINELNITI